MMKEGILMEFREISTFLQVAQHQSFSKAAKQLGYSQAAVTIQIKQLDITGSIRRSPSALSRIPRMFC